MGRYTTFTLTSRKELYTMNPCITIDVSKESSHVQGFLDFNIHQSKVKKIDHTLEGFSEIDYIRNQLIEKTQIEPLIIFEYTGVYHKALQAYLESKNYNYSPVPPLVAAKVRKSDLRDAKTDKRDCKTLAKVFYENKLKTFYKGTDLENRLRDINKVYSKYCDHYQMITVNLLESIDTIYPYFKRLFSEFDCYNALSFFKEYPHPDLFKSHKKTTVVNNLITLTSHTKAYCDKFYDKVLSLVNSTVSGCSKDSFQVEELEDLVEQALFYKKRMTSCLKELSILISNSYHSILFEQLKSIPGIGNNLASRFIAEVRNINRFKSLSALIAFVGTDPRIYASGKEDGEHLHITKLGNKRLRTILFQMVRGMIKKRIQMSKVKDFYYKKKTQPGMKPKVVLVACINKLLGIIYQMNKSGELYSYQIQQ